MSWLKSCNITRSTRCYWCETSNDIKPFQASRAEEKENGEKGKMCSIFPQKSDGETESFVVLFQKVNVDEKNNLWYTP